MPAAHWKQILGAWSFIGLVLTAQTFAILDLSPEPELLWMEISQVLYLQLSRAWLWALLTPVVWALQARIPARRGWMVTAVLVHAVVCATLVLWVLWARHVVGMFFYASPGWWLNVMSITHTFSQLSSRQLIDVLLYGGILAAGYMLCLRADRLAADRSALELREQLARQAVVGEQLRSELTEARMRALKERLHPHFLFNALNAVSGLVRRRDTDRAVDALNQMSHLLRALLNNSARKFIPLEQELDYCRIYLDIEKLRFDDKLTVEFAIDPLAHQVPVPALLLQPLAENAIKHGLARRRSPGRVRIEARISGDRLQLAVENDPAEHLSGQPAPVSHGIGLSTIRNRMQIAYGEDFHLHFHLAPPAPTRVEIGLPVSVHPEHPATHETHPHRHR